MFKSFLTTIKSFLTTIWTAIWSNKFLFLGFLALIIAFWIVGQCIDSHIAGCQRSNYCAPYDIPYFIAKTLLILSFVFLALMSLLQYAFVLFREPEGNNDQATLVTPRLSKKRKIAAYFFTVLIALGALGLSMWEITKEESLLFSNTTDINVLQGISPLFPSVKNIVVVVFALLFLMIDFLIQPMLKDPQKQITFDIGVLATLFLSSAVLGQIHQHIGYEMAIGYNSGVISFHVILATLLFDA